jgi:hypothetical protein
VDGWMDNIIIWINFFIGLCVCVIGYELIFFCFKNTTVTSNMNRKQNNNQSPFFFFCIIMKQQQHQQKNITCTIINQMQVRQVVLFY